MNIPPELNHVILVDPEIMGGTPCFAGTRVPISTFLDHVQEGVSLDRFLQGYPSVHRIQARAVLNWLSKQSRASIGLDLAS